MEPAGVFEFAVAEPDLRRQRLGAKAEHQRARERPGLRRLIDHRARLDAGFLEHLAAHGVLEALTRLDEAGDRRIAPGGPGRLAPEQRAVAVGHEHDDRRIDAREEFGVAARALADHDTAVLL